MQVHIVPTDSLRIVPLPFILGYLATCVFTALGFTLAGMPRRKVFSVLMTLLGLPGTLWLANVTFRFAGRGAGSIWVGISLCTLAIVPLIPWILAVWRVFNPDRFRDRRWVLAYSLNLMACFLVYSISVPKFWARSSKSTEIIKDVDRLPIITPTADPQTTQKPGDFDHIWDPYFKDSKKPAADPEPGHVPQQ